MSDAVHARGCSEVLTVESQVLPRYSFCPECKRMVLDQNNQQETAR